jgi:glycyl-tRNA synthetase beta chain
MKPLLLEIGTEEIPARFLPHGMNSLKSVLTKLLRSASIRFGDIQVFATPRRLAVCIQEVSEKQEGRHIEILGPSRKIAFDETGQPTKAAIGFAKTHNVETKNLKIVTTERGEYVAAALEERGRKTQDVLKDLIPKAVISLQFPKSMRWGNGTIRFARPIQWVAALFGAEIIDFELDGLKSGNTTRGHRFLSPEPLHIKDPVQYSELLANHYVIVNSDERKKIILAEMTKIESAMSVKVREDNELLDTVSFLVEYPTVILGSFDADYLSLPKQLLITTMKSHQKYFSVEDKNGELLPYFIVISNTKPENNEMIKKGAERVLKARLEDARFYYREDQKIPFGEYIKRLKNVTFQETLGSLHDKIKRIAYFCSYCADTLDIDNTDKLLRAAELSKADLVTGIVREFPELQGYMGMIYARNSGEDEEVASAIYEHYLPRFSGDTLPSSTTSTLISLADKMDNIASFFHLGIIPTGSEDPFALRRQATGVIIILQHSDFNLSLDDLIDKALQGVESFPPTTNKLRTSMLNFFKQRLEWILLEEGYRNDLVNSVLASGIYNIKEIKNRVKILSSISNSPEFPELLTAAKRVYNILSRVKTGSLKTQLLTSSHEKKLYASFHHAEKRLQKNNYEVLFELKEPINVFFDNVMVMDKDQNIRENRLALLSSIKNLFDFLGDFSKISFP